jgi:hypothetical protein
MCTLKTHPKISAQPDEHVSTKITLKRYLKRLTIIIGISVTHDGSSCAIIYLFIMHLVCIKKLDIIGA